MGLRVDARLGGVLSTLQRYGNRQKRSLATSSIFRRVLSALMYVNFQRCPDVEERLDMRRRGELPPLSVRFRDTGLSVIPWD